MIKLQHLLEESKKKKKRSVKEENVPTQMSQTNYFDWTQDFDVFKNTINSATESAKKKFEKTLSSKILNKSVLIRASKAQPKQPVKDYTLKRVTNVSIVDYSGEWIVVLKNEFNKEYCLTTGYKIKVLGNAVAAEPGAVEAPQVPEPKQPVPNPPTPTGKPSAPPAPQKPEIPLKEENQGVYFERLDQALTAVEEFVVKNRIQLDPKEHHTDEADPFGVRGPFMYGGIAYNTNKKADYKITSYKGAPTRKYLHVDINRLDTGKYELTQYVL